MRARSLRWLGRHALVAVLGCAAIAFGAVGYGVAHAQAVVKIPDNELPAGVKNAGDYAPPGWDGSGTHPGKKDFDTYCSSCHYLNDQTKTGPGLQGLFDKISKGPKYKGWDVQKRILEYVKSVKTGGPLSDDPYFKEIQQKDGTTPGVDMQTRGGLPDTATDREILNVIDYILRFKQPVFNEDEYLREVKLGKELVSGARLFKWGGPSCTGCHTIGADPDLRGANIGRNVADTYVLARRRGTDEKNNYSDGLKDILSGPDAPAAHYYYKDEEGSHPLTKAELLAVTTFFEQAARETGTEQDSNYLPIFALLAAAFLILLLEPGVLNLLFVKPEGEEYIDGPYAEEEHHHPSTGSGQAPEEPKAEEKPAEETRAEAKAEEEKPAEESKAEADKTDEASAESEDKGDAESDDSAEDKK